MTTEPVELHVISDSTGETATRLVHALEAQFPEQLFEEVRHARAETVDDLERAVRRARGRRAVVVYTLVEPELRRQMRTLCRRARVHYCDLLGHPIEAVARVSGTAARMTPGARATLDTAYFRSPRIQRMRSPRISESRCASIVSPTTFDCSIVNSSAGGSMPFTSGTFAVLYPR